MVSNLINAKGNPTVNQFVIFENDSITFQSYNSKVCKITNNGKNLVVTFGRDWDYSRTTMKHLNEFLAQNSLLNLTSAKDIRTAIKNGYMWQNKSVKVVYDETMV